MLADELELALLLAAGFESPPPLVSLAAAAGLSPPSLAPPLSLPLSLLPPPPFLASVSYTHLTLPTILRV